MAGSIGNVCFCLCKIVLIKEVRGMTLLDVLMLYKSFLLFFVVVSHLLIIYNFFLLKLKLAFRKVFFIIVDLADVLCL